MSAKVKAAVRDRDGWRCTECGFTQEEHVVKFGKSLEVHRIDPGSDYTLDGCVTLCNPCHVVKPRTEWGKSRRVILNRDVHKQILQLAEKNYRPVPSEVHSILVEYLRQRGLWIYHDPNPQPVVSSAPLIPHPDA